MQKLSSLLSDRQEEFLEEVEDYCQKEIAPIANKLDRCHEALHHALLGLGQRHWLALRVPEEWGGQGLSAIAFGCFQILLARYSGALCFLQTQHQGAAMQLVRSPNQSLKKSYLPHLASGKKLVGVGFSHLRRQGKPSMTAREAAGGYQLQGIVPWVTGVGILEDFIVGSSLPNGEEVYGLVPLHETQQSEGGFLKLGHPLELAVINSTRTASASFEDWFLADDFVVARQPEGNIYQQDRHNILNHGFLALGCAWAAVDILRAATQSKSLSFLEENLSHWQSRLSSLENQMLDALISPIPYRKKLKLRSQAIILAGRCAQAAIVVSGGQANLLTHPAQRVYREALIFTISGQTTDVMEASLSELSF